MGGIIKAIVKAVSSVIDAVVDLVVDIIELALDIIEAFIDLIVDIVESIIEAIASLLGFEDQIVEQFEVHNQPLFDDPDKNVMSEVIVKSVRDNEDIAANILYTEAFQSGKQNIKKFTKFIDTDQYFEGFAEVQANILNVDHDALVNAICSNEGVPCSLTWSRLGRLASNTWAKYWLQENKGYSVATNTLVYNGITYTYSSIQYVETTGTYLITLVAPRVDATTSHSAVAEAVGITHTISIDETLFVSNEDAAPGTGVLDVDSHFRVNPVYHVPAKATGVHYIAKYAPDMDPLSAKLFVYQQGSGGYPALDDSALEFDVSTEDEIQVLPAIPLRVDNDNFNSSETAKTNQIRDLVDKLGLDADILIKNIMEDVADAGIDDYENKVDHVFLNFGVRMWDTSQSGLNYLYRMFSLLHVAQASTEGTYLATPEADEKAYNNLMVSAFNYKSVFKFAYIKSNHYTLAEVNADPTSTINGVYYSDLSKFNDLNIIKRPYYVSSGQTTYNVGYIANNIGEVNQFIAGTLPRQATYLEAVKDYVQVSKRLNYSGALRDAAGDVLTDGALKPSLVYKVEGTGLQVILRIGEAVTSNQEFRYYQCVENGLNELIVKAPIGALRVVDAATDKFKFVKSNIADEDSLMLPLSYDLIKHLPNRDVTNIILASAHISIYVAHYEVIEMPFWAKLLQIVMIVLAVMSLMTGNMQLADALWAMGKHMVKQMIIREIIMYIAKEFSPELAMIVAIAYGVSEYNSLSSTMFNDVAPVLGSTANLVGDVISVHVEGENHLLQNTYEDLLKTFNDAMDHLKTLRQEMGLDEDGNALPEIARDTRGNIRAISPTAYYDMSINGVYALAFVDYDYANKFDTIYELPQYS